MRPRGCVAWSTRRAQDTGVFPRFTAGAALAMGGVMRTVATLALTFSFLAACTRPAPTAAPPVAAAPLAAQPATTVAAVTAQTASIPATSATTPTPVVASTLKPRAHSLRVDRLVVARGVESREPQGADTVFAANEKRLFAFVEVSNPERAEGDVHVQFVSPSGETEPPIALSVGESPRWRTWAFTRRVHTPGTWRAVVRDDRDHVLASTEFDVRG
jgi:hypothetical protein